MSKITVVPIDILSRTWNDSYYPPDLPGDWRLAYFANDFSACLLTVEDLATLAANADEVISDLPDGFRIFLEITDQKMPELCRIVYERLSGLVVFAGSPLQSGFEKNLQDYGKPFCVFARRTQSSCRQMDLNEVGLPPCHTDPFNADLHCAFISGPEARDLRQLKERLLHWLRKDNDERFLFVDAGMEIDAIRSVSVLVQLLT